MEFIVSILVAAAVLLWFRTRDLSLRLERMEDRARDVLKQLQQLRADLAADAIEPGGSSVAAATGEATTTELVPPGPPEPTEAPVSPWEAHLRGAPAPQAVEAPTGWVVPGNVVAPQPQPAPSAWVTPGRKAATAASTVARAATAAPVGLAESSAEPGPGMTHRLLVRLGMTPPEAGEGFSRAAIEAWLEGRMLAAIGGVALVLGAVFFLSLAFSRGWITEPMRVLIGLVAGAGILVLGELALSKLRGIVGPVLVAVGLAVVSLALIAATRLYGLVPVEWGLVGAFVAAVAAAAIAIRHDSQLIAGFGLVAVLAAPPVLGASPTLVTLAFVAVTLVGTTAIALFRTWTWLPSLAFVLAAPQLAAYVSGDAPTAETLVAIAGFWIVNTVAAGGEEFRHATDRLRTSSVTVLLADAAFTIWAGFTVLSGPDETWRGSFLAVVALAHLVLGIAFLIRDGDRHPFGLLVATTGLAALTMAVPVQFGGPAVPVAWAAEAVALAWVAVQRRHPLSTALAIVLGAMAIGHLLTIEYPPGSVIDGFDRTWPFVGPEGLTFGFILGALIVAGLLVSVAWVRGGLAVVGGLITFYVLPAELSSAALVAAWAALTVLATGAYTRIVSPRLGRDFVEDRISVLALSASTADLVRPMVADLSRLVRPGFVAVAALAGIATLGHLVGIEFPIARLGSGSLHGTPYLGPEGLALAATLAGLALIGWLIRSVPIRLGAAGIGLGLLAYSVSFEIDPPHVMIAWAAFGLASLWLMRRLTLIEPIPAHRRSVTRIAERLPYLAAALATFLLVVQAFVYAGAVTFARHIAGDLGPPSAPFLDERSYALAILAAAALAAGWTWRGMTGLLVGGIAAALVAAWLLPFEIRTGYAVAGWSALALGGIWLIRRVPQARLLLGVPAAALAGIAALVTIAFVAPPDRLVVDASTTVVGWPILTDATVALGALALALGASAWLHRADPYSRPALIAAGVSAVYMLSVGLVDVFQRQVGSVALDELQKESQVGLSVLWSVLGGIGFATGLRLRRPPIRLAGLALLGLATVKVFLVDLAALDVAYRVLSLVALGVLLLGSAMVYARMQHPHQPGTPKPA